MKKIILSIAVLFFLTISCEDVINEENITHSVVKTQAPSNNSVLATKAKIAFHWDLVYGASSYHLQVATPAFSNASQIVIDTVLVDTLANPNSFVIDSLLAKAYEWRVKAQNSAFETNYTTNAFTVKEP